MFCIPSSFFVFYCYLLSPFKIFKISFIVCFMFFTTNLQFDCLLYVLSFIDYLTTPVAGILVISAVLFNVSISLKSMLFFQFLTDIRVFQLLHIALYSLSNSSSVIGTILCQLLLLMFITLLGTVQNVFLYVCATDLYCILLHMFLKVLLLSHLEKEYHTQLEFLLPETAFFRYKISTHLAGF